uniref:Uncharacterized protein n=1 Tax=Arundo donax TaxID=35708 RepID=A0A0A9T4Q5_ARUDO
MKVRMAVCNAVPHSMPAQMPCKSKWTG